MSTSDGQSLIKSGGSYHMVECTRWEELASTAIWHGEISDKLRVKTTFVMLNSPGNGGSSTVITGEADEGGIKSLRKTLSST